MTVLRFETKTLPAEIIQTMIVGIPAREWELMRVKKWIFSVVYLLIIPSLLVFGTVAFLLYLLPALMQAGEIGPRTEAYSLMVLVILTLFALLVVTAIVYSVQKIVRLELDLLTKHGWNGASAYRVELEHQSCMH